MTFRKDYLEYLHSKEDVRLLNGFIDHLIAKLLDIVLNFVLIGYIDRNIDAYDWVYDVTKNVEKVLSWALAREGDEYVSWKTRNRFGLPNKQLRFYGLYYELVILRPYMYFDCVYCKETRSLLVTASNDFMAQARQVILHRTRVYVNEERIATLQYVRLCGRGLTLGDIVDEKLERGVLNEK